VTAVAKARRGIAESIGSGGPFGRTGHRDRMDVLRASELGCPSLAWDPQQYDYEVLTARPTDLGTRLRNTFWKLLGRWLP
jgi:hypothetical protein